MKNSSRNNQRGFALVMTVFIIALATLIVMSFAQETYDYQRATRSFTERIQADYAIKSGFSFAEALIKLPKQTTVPDSDSFSDLWYQVGTLPALPISDFPGEFHFLIVDENSKINVNGIRGFGISSHSGVMPEEDFWKNALSKLFQDANFPVGPYPNDRFYTLGNVGLDPDEQVAVIDDWIDLDHNSFVPNPNFGGRGKESSLDKNWFYNREMKFPSELAMVHGMTLENSAKIARFVRTWPAVDNQININTAPQEVLTAMGLNPKDVADVMALQQQGGYDAAGLANLIALYPPNQAPLFNKIFSRNSKHFSAFVMVKMASSTRWGMAEISATSPGPNRRTKVMRFEIL